MDTATRVGDLVAVLGALLLIGLVVSKVLQVEAISPDTPAISTLTKQYPDPQPITLRDVLANDMCAGHRETWFRAADGRTITLKPGECLTYGFGRVSP